MADEWLKEAAQGLAPASPDSELPEEDKWLGDAAGEIMRAHKSRLSTSLESAAGGNPEQIANIRRDAKQLNLDPETAKRDPQALPKLKAAQAADQLFGQEDTPATRKAFEDPNFADVAHDRVEQLGVLERVLNGLKRGGTYAAGDLETLGYATNSLLESIGQGFLPKPQGRTQAEWEWTKAQAENERLGGLKTISKAAAAIPEDPVQAEFVRLVDSQESTMGGIWEGAKFLATHPSMFAVLGAEQVVPMVQVGQLGAGAGAGARALAQPALNKVIANQAKRAFVEKALPLAGVQFTSNAGMVYGAEMIEGVNRGMAPDEAMARAGTKALVEGLINAPTAFIPGLKETTRLRRVVNTGLEATKQGVAGASGAAGSAAAVGEDITLSELLLEGFGELTTAPVDVAIAALGNPDTKTREAQQAIKLVNEAAKAEEAAGVAAQMDALGELAMNEELAKRDPETFEAFVQQVAGEETDTVFIEAAKFKDVLEQSGLNPAEVLTAIPSVGDQYVNALATGADLKIPLGEYVTKIATTEYHQQLTPHVRLRAEGMSPAEAETWQETAIAEFEQRANEADVTEDEKAPEPARQIFERLKEQLGAIQQEGAETTGLFGRTGKISQKAVEGYARLHFEIAKTLAARGVDPMKYYGNLFVQGTEAPGAQFDSTLQQDEKDTTIGGIQVEEITDAEEQNRVIEQHRARVAGRPARQSEVAGTTVSGKPARDGWDTATRVTRGGKPATVFRGSRGPIRPASFENLGAATGVPASGLGVFFSSSATEAQGYGPRVSEVFLDIRNPKVYVPKDLKELTGQGYFESVESAALLASELRMDGHDGIAIDLRIRDEEGKVVDGSVHFVAFDPEQVILTEESTTELFQSRPITQAQRNDIGLYSAVEQAVLDMPLPAWKAKPKQVLTDEERARLNELRSGPPINVTSDPAYPELRELIAKEEAEVPRAKGTDIWAKVKSMGVKKEELEWLGLEEYLTAGDKFSREEVIEFIQDNGVRIEEVVAEEGESGAQEFDWSEEVDDDPGNWEHRVEDFMYDFDNGQYEDYILDYDEWLEDHAQDVIDSYAPSVPDDVLEEANDLAPEEVADFFEGQGYDVKDDMASSFRDDYEEAATRVAEQEYMDDPYYLYTDEATGYQIHGNDDVGYSLDIGDGYNFLDAYSFSEAEIRAYDVARDGGALQDEEDESVARWSEYTMDGDHDNYRELKLTLPDIEGDFYNETHFPDRNIVAFLRVDDRELPTGDVQDTSRQIELSEFHEFDDPAKPLRYGIKVIDAAGKVIRQDYATAEERQQVIDIIEAEPAEKPVVANTYFIDEMQSDWHQDGRKTGYATGLEDPGVLDEKAQAALAPAEQVIGGIWDSVIAQEGVEEHEAMPGTYVVPLAPDEFGAERKALFNYREFEQYVYSLVRDPKQAETNKNVAMVDELATPFVTKAGYGTVKSSLKEYDAYLKQARAERYGAPDAPFKGDAWIALGLKRAIVDAVENGYESIAWVDSNVLTDRWSDRYATLYATQYDKKMPSIVKKLTGVMPEHLAQDGTEHEHQELGYWVIPITDELKAKVQDTGFALYQKKDQAPRGKIGIATDITEGPNVISLLEGADLSTFLHESGHFLFEVWRDLASDPETAAEFKEDMQALLDHVGVATLDEWNAMSLEERREGHETVARSFEAYLFEGKAPTPALRKLFNTFAAWLRKVYRSLKALDVEMTDEVRAVFDRMVASEEQILLAERNQESRPLFTTAEDAGMTPEEFEAYQALALEAHEEAVNQLAARSLRDMQWLSNAKNRKLKELQRQADGLRAEIREQATAETEAEPVYRALRYFKKGESVDADGNVQKAEGGHRLSVDALEAMYGEAVDAPEWKALGYGAYGVLGKEGIDPDMAAEWFGFSSGDALVRALLDARPMETVIEGLTDQRMVEEHADLSDNEAIEAAANGALHNEVRTRMVATELRAVSKLAALRTIDRKQANEYAKAAIAKLKVRDVSATPFATAERRAGKAAEEALRKGETLAAARAKQDQFLNGQLVREAQKAKTEVEKIVEYLKKLDTAAARKRIDPEYMDQVDQILARFDLRKGVTLKAIDKRTSLREWVKQQEEMGLAPVVDDRLMDEALRVHYKEMPLADLRELNDSIRNIVHLGKLKKKLLTARDKRAFEAVVDELEASIVDNASRTIPVDIEHDITVAPKEWLRSFAASHRKLGSYVRQMDGFAEGGPMWEHFARPMNERGDLEAVEREKATLRFSELFENYTSFKESAKRTAAKLTAGKFEAAKPWMMQKVHIPEIGRSLTNQARLAVALNWGNMDNRDRVMEGYGWTEEQAQAVLNTLEKADWDFVQSVWDFLDEYWPRIADKEQRVTGLAPEKVAAAEVQTPYGAYRGGYYPIKYDHRQSPRTTELQAQEMAKRALQGAFTRSTTRRGHTKERTGGGGQKVRLDFGVMFEHVNQVIHDLTWHEWLIDANRMLGNRRIQQAIYDHYGREAYDALKQGVEDIAAGDIPAETAWERSINWLRTGTSIAGMGWSLWTSLLQPFGLTQGMVRIGPKWVGRGLSTWLGNAARMESTIKTIHERSDFMRLRAKTMQREINEIQNKVMAGGIMSPVTDSYFYLIVKAQQVADVPIWLGQYEKMIAEGRSEEDAAKLADQAVLDSQGGGQIKDLAKIQRGSPLLKLWTNFYSYFNTTFNLTAEKYRGTDFKKPKDIGRFAVDMMLLYWLPATLSALMREALRGGCDEGDMECLTEAIVRENLSYMAGTMVGMREMSGFLNGYYGYSGPAGTRFFSESMKLLGQIEQGELDEAALKALNNTAGILFHYPSAQVQRTAEGFTALVEGNTDSPLAPVFGPPKD